MKRLALSGAFVLAAFGAGAAEKPTRFWNLTSQTVVSVRLSHAGSGEFGDNLAVGDPDGIDHDERLKLPDLPSGQYDIALGFKGGRVCLARNITIVTGKVFSVEDKALTSCANK
jgi:hypothetical protein